jgi:hypothetical protein
MATITVYRLSYSIKLTAVKYIYNFFQVQDHEQGEFWEVHLERILQLLESG